MVECGKSSSSLLCEFHPKEVVVGVCALCLNERLLLLFAAQQKKNHHRSDDDDYYDIVLYDDYEEKKKKKNEEARHHLFALLKRGRRTKFHHSNNASSTYQDSFISIKFENDGVGRWEGNKASSLKHSDNSNNNMCWSKSSSSKSKVAVVEPRVQLKWRKRIGHIFHFIKSKKSTKGSVCHAGTKFEGVKMRHGWIRTLTKRKSKK